jgi:hypothetical protein
MKKEIEKEEVKYLGASDIVNGTASLYKIREKEMKTDLENISNEIRNKN